MSASCPLCGFGHAANDPNWICGTVFTPCRCEHASHFDDATDSTVHRYGKVQSAVALRTIYGTYDVCRACVDGAHMRVDWAERAPLVNRQADPPKPLMHLHLGGVSQLRLCGAERTSRGIPWEWTSDAELHGARFTLCLDCLHVLALAIDDNPNDKERRA